MSQIFLFKMLIQNIYFCHTAGWHTVMIQLQVLCVFPENHQRLFTGSIYFFSSLISVCERLCAKMTEVCLFKRSTYKIMGDSCFLC